MSLSDLAALPGHTSHDPLSQAQAYEPSLDGEESGGQQHRLTCPPCADPTISLSDPSNSSGEKVRGGLLPDEEVTLPCSDMGTLSGS